MTRYEPEKFAAVFVLRISVANDTRIVTRFETYIFHATTAGDAHQQATGFAPRLDDKYRNSDGDVVTIECLGIHELDRVEPDGVDGPGLVSSAEFMTPTGVQPSALVPGRNSLACFNQQRDRPNYPNLDQ